MPSRRFVQTDTAHELARILKPGGRLRVATDVRVYADWALPLLLDVPELGWTAKGADDWRIPPADHITTRYQSKHLGDIDPVFHGFRARGGMTRFFRGAQPMRDSRRVT